MKKNKLLFSTTLALFLFLGTWGSAWGQALYSEDFTGQDGKGIYGGSTGITTDTSGVDWTVDVGGTLITDSGDNYFWVDNEKFVGLDVDGSAYWSSPSIDVSGIDGVDLSMNLEVINGGANSSGENISIYYTTDPSSENPSYTLLDEYDENSMGSVPSSYSKLNVDVSSTSEFGIRIEIDANGAGTGFSFDTIALTENTVKAEPTDHVADFITTGTIEKVNLSWTDVSSSPAPDGYLIKTNDTGLGSITDPTDTSTESDDTDLSDGSAVLNVLQGTEEASFSGLDETTTYYFKIYPYTNSGSDIDYKTDGTVPQDDATTLDTPDIVLNEFLADPDGDANGDGTTSSDDDEFIELVNTGSSNLTITNWTIEDAGSTTHTFEDPTVLKPMQSIVVFGGGAPTGNFGGAIVQTTGSLSLNNSGDDIILRNDSGVEILSYTFGSSEGSANQSYTRNPDLTGEFADHTSADTEDGSSFSPGTRIDGSTFQPSVEIAGDAGWRMLSLPINGTVEDVSDDTPIQGLSGGPDASEDPNLYIYDATTPEFTAPSSTASLSSGTGFILYFFDNTTNSSSELPDTLHAFGTSPDSDVAVSLEAGEFNLIGNPFNSNIALDDLSGDVVSPIQYWDDAEGTPIGGSAASTTGSYVSKNFGSSNGEIAPAWQGFMLESTTATSIDILASSRTSDAATFNGFQKSNNEIKFREIAFHLEVNNYSDVSTKLYFTEKAKTGKDNFDGTKLQPLNNSPTIAFLNNFGEGDQILVQEARALTPNGVQEYRLDFNDAGVSGTFKLSWPEMKHIPSDWSLQLKDFETGKTINMQDEDSYSFDVESRQKRATTSVLTPKSVMAKSDVSEERFAITVTANSSVSTESGNQPEAFTLEQNYPNPFNPTTSIQYSVAHAGAVSITVYNVMGQKVATLVNETKSAGTYRINWDAANMASGIYHYRLQSAGQVITKQMTLIK